MSNLRSAFNKFVARFVAPFVLTSFILLSGSAPTFAQSALRIAATVNEDMISLFDLNARMSVSIYFAKLPATNETRRRLAPQILRSLIDDKLRNQEAKRLGITVSKEELNAGIRAWEKRSGVARGGMASLAQRLGIDKSMIAEQIETGLLWRKTIGDLFLSTVQISDKEIDDILLEEISKKGQPEFLISEIFLPFDGAGKDREVNALADRLIQQIKAGAKFAAVARNFSQSPTASVGGSLGWNRLGHLPVELEQVIKQMGAGQISQPVRTHEGFYVLNLRQKRAIEPFVEKSSKPTMVSLYQIHFALPNNGSHTDTAAIMDKARDVSQQARNCTDMETLGKKVGSPLSGSTGKLAINQLSPKMLSVVNSLVVSQASQPITSGNGVIVMMVCERIDATVKKIDRATLRDKIRAKLIDERMNLSAIQFLRNLRRAAIVDVRL